MAWRIIVKKKKKKFLLKKTIQINVNNDKYTIKINRLMNVMSKYISGIKIWTKRFEKKTENNIENK